MTAAQDTSGDDPVVASVNGEAILRSEVYEAATKLPAEYLAQLDRVLPVLVERLIDMKLISSAADGAALDEDEEVARRVAAQKVSIIREVYLERALAARVTDEMLQSHYETYLAENPPAAEVSARHILVESQEDAKAVIAELDGGGDFAELARTRSTGPSSSQGGDLGFFSQEQMVPEFADAAFALETGSYTKEPVQTQFGWHVILVEDRRTTPPPAYEELEEQLREEASREVLREMMADLRAAATIEVFPEVLVPPGEESSQ